MDELTAVLGFDPEKLAEEADAFFARLREFHAADATAITRAESADRRIAVEYSISEGVRDLHIDPRAMRSSAAELAETILELIHRAQREAQEEGRRQATEALGQDGPLIKDRDAIGRELRNADTAVRENLAAANETLSKLQSLLR